MPAFRLVLAGLLTLMLTVKVSAQTDGGLIEPSLPETAALAKSVAELSQSLEAQLGQLDSMISRLMSDQEALGTELTEETDPGRRLSKSEQLYEMTDQIDSLESLRAELKGRLAELQSLMRTLEGGE